MKNRDGIKHCEKWLPLKQRSFWERDNFFNQINLKAHNRGVFHYSFANSITNWAKVFTDLLLYAYVEIDQVYDICTSISQPGLCLGLHVHQGPILAAKHNNLFSMKFLPW